MADRKVDDETGVETTGHSWDGIEELNNPLPRWWLWTLYLSIIWGIGYVIAYPAWPMVSGATQGMLGWSSRGQVAAEITAHESQNAELVTALLAAGMMTLPDQSDLNRYAVARGGSVFRAQCSQCHGSGAAGANGYPNLLDSDWLWGGARWTKSSKLSGTAFAMKPTQMPGGRRCLHSATSSLGLKSQPQPNT